MGKSKTGPVDFQLDGQFLGLILNQSGKAKGIRLKTADGEQAIQLAKPMRDQVAGLAPGDWIEVKGKQKIKKTGVLKRKAGVLRVLNPERSTGFFSTSLSIPQTVQQPKAKVLVCKRSDCMKRGGKALCQALEANLRDRGLADQVTIQMTGCMKQCKTGPNMIVMPGKKVHRRVSASHVPDLLDQHFSTTTPSYLSNKKRDTVPASPSYR